MAMREELFLTTAENSSFSKQIPGLQLAWDSTSLGTFKDCPRKYYYSIVLGYQPREISIHLTFGLWMHGGVERYHHAKAQGQSHEQALRSALKWALCETWDKTMKRGFISNDKNKNRWTYIRTLVWYLDQFEHDPIETFILENGRPAVELSFRFNLEAMSTKGEPYMYSGHLDRIGKLNGVPYICDTKTTAHTIDQRYWEKWTPGNQFSGYCLAGKIAFGIPVQQGLIVDAAQVAVTFSRFERQIIPRTDDQLEEWYWDALRWIRLAEQYALMGHWPMNDMACHHYGGCQYLPICSKSPKVRDQWLEKAYHKRVWDPLKVRGDI